MARNEELLATAKNPGSAVPVNVSPTAVLAANTARISATIINDSDEVIYLALGPVAAVNAGIRLNPAGGAYEINANNPFNGQVTAICVSGGKNLCVTEV